MGYKIIKNDELMHHGVPGQKWGVRNYQTADGSLTSAGKARYGVGNGLQKTSSNVAARKKIATMSGQQKKQLSDWIIESRNQRKENERASAQAALARNQSSGGGGGGSASFSYYKDGDPDFDDKNFDEKNRLGDTDFFGFQRPDGTYVVIEEDMKWELPKGMNLKDATAKLTELESNLEKMRSQGQKWTNDDFVKMANKALSGK